MCVCVCVCVCASICVTYSETCRGQWRHVFQSPGTGHSKPWALGSKSRMAALVSHLQRLVQSATGGANRHGDAEVKSEVGSISEKPARETFILINPIGKKPTPPVSAPSKSTPPKHKTNSLASAIGQPGLVEALVMRSECSARVSG